LELADHYVPKSDVVLGLLYLRLLVTGEPLEPTLSAALGRARAFGTVRLHYGIKGIRDSWASCCWRRPSTYRARADLEVLHSPAALAV